MTGTSLVGLLENIYGEQLIVGCENGFNEFTQNKAEEILDRYRSITESRDFLFTHNTFSRRGLLLVRFITTNATRCAGGHHSLGLNDDRACRVNYLKTLLLAAPSVSVPDQVYMLAAEMAVADDRRANELRGRWLEYIKYLVEIRPLTEHGAVRIISDRRVDVVAQYNDGSPAADKNLERVLNNRFIGTPESAVATNTIKYNMSLLYYRNSAFYEDQPHVNIHKEIMQEGTNKIFRILAPDESYTVVPAEHFQTLSQAADKLSIIDLTEARLAERELQSWFECYNRAIEADSKPEFDERLKEGFSKLGRLSDTIVDRGKKLAIKIGAGFAAGALLNAFPPAVILGAVLKPALSASLVALFGLDDAPENDLSERARIALLNHYVALLQASAV